MKSTSTASTQASIHSPLFPSERKMLASKADTASQFLSTAEAARMLGLSTTLIQTLVDNNELKGWKTRGGHRRIAIQSVMDYQSHSGRKSSTAHRHTGTPRIMVVVETPERAKSATWVQIWSTLVWP